MTESRLKEASSFAVSSLIGLETPEKIAEILAQVYRVRDSKIAENYLEEAASLGLTTSELVSAMLRIAPLALEATGDRAATPQVEPAEVLRELLLRADPARFETIKDAFERPRDNEDWFDELLRKTSPLDLPIKTDQIDWSGYFAPRKDSPLANKAVMGSESGECCLIAAHHRGLGLLRGPQVCFTGLSGESAFATCNPGWVLYGPRIDLAPGYYVLDVAIEIRDNETLMLDVVSNQGLHKIFEINLVGDATFRHKFELKPQDRKLEVRIANELGRPVGAKLKRILVARS